MPEKFSQLGLDVEATGSAADDAKKPQKRGGKGKKNSKFCCYSMVKVSFFQKMMAKFSNLSNLKLFFNFYFP